MRNAALSSTNIRDYVYKGKCLLPVQETGSRWASDVWRASPRCQRAMGEGLCLEEEWRNRLISSNLRSKAVPLPLFFFKKKRQKKKRREEVAEQETR